MAKNVLHSIAAGGYLEKIKTYMNSEIIFSIYKPHTNKGNKLKKLLFNHIPILKSNNLYGK